MGRNAKVYTVLDWKNQTTTAAARYIKRVAFGCEQHLRTKGWDVNYEKIN